ncbi:MAG: hypothetical protein Kow0056_03040 [Coriobacteriia bacterium]
MPSSGGHTLAVSDLSAVIFDMDGVVTATAKVHAEAWRRMFDEFLEAHSSSRDADLRPFDPHDDYLRYVDGKPRFDGAKSFLESRGFVLPDGHPDDPPDADTVWGISARKQQYFLEALRQHGADPYQDTLEFISALKSRGLPIAIITASRNCDEVLAAAGVSGLFDAKVDGNDALRLGLAGKPAPDVFLEAARRLRVSPQRSVVVEDAEAGVAAGRAGGFGLVIGVDRAGHADSLKAAGADIVVSDLSEVHLK